MIYEEFKQYKVIEDKVNPFCTLYELEDGSRFYIEPVFYTMLQGFKEQFKDRYEDIINELIKVVKKNKKVIFTGSFDYPQTVAEDYVILEVTDITDRLQIFAEDKSRGSDYGD